ncbi:MAG: DUF1553 domain-containing protein [Planctomycetes bacterium]|nr:DUF1553 domain-containing protein [Planctomycetota bacterium]
MRGRSTAWNLILTCGVAAAAALPVLGGSPLDDPPGNKTAPARTQAPPPLEFNRDIRPILSDHCFQCHGPDRASRQADLRLDDPQSAFAERDGRRAIAPGAVAASELMRRIASDDPAIRMPPESARRPLTERQVELLRQWIAAGAEFEPHWSFVPPRSSSPPSGNLSSAISPTDLYVQATLETLGLTPSLQADPAHLLRRVTIDLTGLPPDEEELPAADGSGNPDSYERSVDRLLASPRYGERMALDWLDASRYADTHGYLFDTERFMWRWRDQLIAALNSNQPFDQFTIEQLAGDLLPGATLEQKIASGFNRNHIINNEAGAIADEYFVENVLDRLNTTATVWLGLSLACAQCHDHKYDPVSQREYYQLYAFFNNVPEIGLDGFNANAKPLLPAPTDDDRRRLAGLDAELADAESGFAPLEAQIRQAQSQWEQERFRPYVASFRDLVTALRLDGDGLDLASADRVAEFKEGVPTYEGGVLGQSAVLDGQKFLELGDLADFDIRSPFTLSAWVYPTTVDGRRAVFSRMEPAEGNYRGYTLQLIQGVPALFLVHEFPENLLQVQAKKSLEAHRWYHLAATYDGSGKAEGVQLYLDGVPQETGLIIDKLTNPFAVKRPLQIGNGHPGAKFLGRLDEVRIHQRALSTDEVAALPGVSIDSLLAADPASRGDEASRRIREHYLAHQAPSDWREKSDRHRQTRAAREKAVRAFPTVMVMDEKTDRRETRVLARGAYNQPGDAVDPATPAFLPAFPPEQPRSRLGLARWIASPENPLTARVTVNRVWQLSFSQGIVRTTENFGYQGDPPSHPELLDWLSLQFTQSGWDMKRLRRSIVCSTTYRQQSIVDATRARIDPTNRWLSRGPRWRIPAEFLRDAALAWSGLLVERIGGPSIKPYMPPDVWREVAFDPAGATLTAQVYKQDQGASLYRRGIYTFWKRTAPPPTMSIFDAPDRERCVVRRETTNTPMQALVLMNDPTFVEAARKLAERMCLEQSMDSTSRIYQTFRLLTGRPPETTELRPLLGLLTRQLQRFEADPAAAAALLKTGDTPSDDRIATAELAAYTIVASVLLNLDETLTVH